MTYKELEDLVKKYGVDPKSVGFHYDGQQETYYSFKYSDNLFIANRDPKPMDDMWEVVVSMPHKKDTWSHSSFIKTCELKDYADLCLKMWSA